MSRRAQRSRKGARRAGRARMEPREISLSRQILQSAQFIFLVETALNTAVFIAIAGVAVGLSELVDVMKTRQFNPHIVFFVQIAEYILFFCDMLWFVVFLGISTYRALANLLRET